MSELSAVVSQLNTTNQNLETVKDSLTSLVDSLSAFMDKITDSFDDVVSSMENLNLSTPQLERAELELDLPSSEPKAGDIKQGSDGQEYKFEGAQWVGLETGRMATQEMAVELNTPVSETNTDNSQTLVDNSSIMATNLFVSVDNLEAVVEEGSITTNNGDDGGDGGDSDEGSDSEDEETRREERGIFAAIGDALEGIGKGMEDLGNSVGDIFESAFGAAAIGSLLLLFVDPELAIEILGGAIDIFVGAIEAVTGLLQGDTEALFDFIQENPITAALASAFLLFKTISVVGVLLTKLVGIGSAISGAVSSIIGGFTALAGVITKIAAFTGAPVLAVVAGIGAAIFSLFAAFKDALGVFKESGSIVATLKEFVISFFANLISIIPRLLQSLGVMILEFLGFEKLAEALGSIDILSGIKEGVSAIFDVLSGIVGIVVAPFKLIFDVVSGVFSGILDVIRGIASVIEGIFTGDFGQIMDGIKGIFGGLFGIITAPFEALADFVVEFIDTIVDTIKAGLKLLNPFSWFSDNEDDVQKEIDEQKKTLETRKDLTSEERANIEQEIELKEQEKKKLEQEKNLEYAEDSGLFEKNLIGESEVDMEKIATARTEQLEAILELEGDDINDEAKAAIGKRLSEDKGLKYETVEGPGGLEIQAVTAESIESSSTENIQELLSMGEGTLDEFTQERLEDELKLRASVSKADDQYLAASLEFSDLGERERKLIEEELALREKAKEEAETSTEEAEAGEKRGMVIPAQGVVGVEDPLMGELKKQIEQDMAREAAFAEMREKSEKEKLELTEKTAEESTDRFESFIGTDSVAEAVTPLQPAIFTDTDSTSATDTSSMLSSMFGTDTSATLTSVNPLSMIGAAVGDTSNAAISTSASNILSVGSVSNETQGAPSLMNIANAIAPVFGPTGPMMANILESFVSSDSSPFSMIGDTISSFFGGGDTVENVGDAMSNMLAEGPLSAISNVLMKDEQNVDSIDSLQQSSVESMEYVSDLRNAQVENNDLMAESESSNVAMMSSVANNTRAVTNNSNTTVINNNGPGIDEITRAFAFNPSY